MLRPVIALLTDFGLADHYVGSMKGVIAGICRDAVIVDLTHGVPPQDIMTAAFELLAGYRAFPHGTVFIVVVDPGVGTGRRAIAARAGEYLFVGPDNGVFDLVFDELPPSLVVELTNAALCAGGHQSDIRRPGPLRPGRGVAGERRAPDRSRARGRRGTAPQLSARRSSPPSGVDGEVVHVDRFGNLVTNIDRRTWPGDVIDRLDVAVSGYRTVRLVSTYAEAAPGEVVALFGSTDRLEIAVKSGNAAEALGVGRGTTVHVSTARVIPCAVCPADVAVAPHHVAGRPAHQSGLQNAFERSMIDFDLTDEQQLLEQSVREWGAREIAPHIRELDRAHRFDRDRVLGGMVKLGLLGVSVPEAYGGAGTDYICLGLVSEELEYVDTSLRVIMSVHAGLNGLTLLTWGTEAQKQKYLVPQALGPEDRRLRPDRAWRRQRRARVADDGGPSRRPLRDQRRKIVDLARRRRRPFPRLRLDRSRQRRRRATPPA